MLTAAGDIDSSNAADLAGMLWPALLSERSSVLLDFTAVTFLGVAGLELLSAANTYAPHRGLKIVLLAGQPAVERAVRAARPDPCTDDPISLPAQGRGPGSRRSPRCP
ncbi:STAS domain-containing protein [Saccharopolyspora rhizosphaerae]|uniref:STAS domain-containing protein n=1 Tax=Saccharopolyspora rhizosphaerae TaxID=2492662 RepID=UPI0013150F36|nr:STAS domain-containing protein [Saccharopolyspora rhizosphaerae]